MKWQLCPKCLGEAKIPAGGTSSAVFETCPVCNGQRIIPEYQPQSTEGKDGLFPEDYIKVLRENLEASKRHQDKRVRKLLTETYEDLISIWEHKAAGRIIPAPPTEGEDAPSEQDEDAIGFLYWLTDVNSPYAVMYGGTPELEKDFRIATENEDFTIEQVYEIYKQQKQTRKP